MKRKKKETFEDFLDRIDQEHEFSCGITEQHNPVKSGHHIRDHSGRVMLTMNPKESSLEDWIPGWMSNEIK